MLRKYKSLLAAVLLAGATFAHSQQGVEPEDRLDPHCESTLSLSETESKPRIVQTHGADLHIYPDKIPPNFTGCQVIWLENGHKLATTHYKAGKISWIRGQEPKDVLPFFCSYTKGTLNKAQSFNIERCPEKAVEAE